MRNYKCFPTPTNQCETMQPGGDMQDWLKLTIEARSLTVTDEDAVGLLRNKNIRAPDKNLIIAHRIRLLVDRK